MKCELCGKEHNGSYGSGRFCSSTCARRFSTKSNFSEINRKRSEKLKGTTIYSDGKSIIHLKDGEKIPNGFVKGNFFQSKCSSFEEFKNRKERKEKSARFSRKKSLILCKPIIDKHNKEVIIEYENILRGKSDGKVFELDKLDTVPYAKYLAVIDGSHPRARLNRVFVHVILAESLLGRSLTSEEIVHHKNEDKLDNRYDNIYIFKNKSEHTRFHNSNYYWLYVEDDVLRCVEISNELLKTLIRAV